MSITLRIEQIANGYLLHTNDGTLKTIGQEEATAEYYPALAQLKEGLPAAIDSAFEREAMRRHAWDAERTPAGYSGPNTAQASDEAVTWAEQHANRDKPGFTIGGERYKEDENTFLHSGWKIGDTTDPEC